MSGIHCPVVNDSAGIDTALKELDEVSSVMTKDINLRHWLLKYSTTTENAKPSKGFL
jgi:hypothetical protein